MLVSPALSAHTGEPVASRSQNVMPDAIVTKVWTVPANPAPGQSVELWASVANAGDVETPAGVPVGTALWVGNSYIGAFFTTGPLKSGEIQSGKCNVNWTATVGTHGIKAVVDDVNRFAESNEGNNESTLWLTIGQPDVVVTDVFTIPANPVPNQVVEVCATVKNIGGASTPEGVAVGTALWVNNTYLGAFFTPGPLGPGASHTGKSHINWTIPAGTFPIKGVVDDVNRFPESNENNNSLERTVTSITGFTLTTAVTPAGSGTIKVTPLQSSYAPGTVVSVYATPAVNQFFYGWSGAATGSTNPLNLTMDGNKSLTATFKPTVACTTPPYQPTPWNDGGKVQFNNNCYNYANNVRTDTFAQPGKYCGKPITALTCADVIRAAKCDGLVPTTKTAVLPAGMTRVALVVDDYDDYHWYRQDSNGMWSHKPGASRVTNVDNSGKVITDVETANRGEYRSMCLYFYICSDQVAFGGHSKIK